jgi:CBS-domain-containing membrane protein
MKAGMPETPLPRLVRDLMTVGVMTCPPKTTVPELAQLLLDHDLDQLVVLDDGKTLSMVGQDDLFTAFARDNTKSLTASDVIWKNLSKGARRLLSKILFVKSESELFFVAE